MKGLHTSVWHSKCAWQILVSKDTVCGSMYSWSQCQAPSCLQQWYWQQPTWRVPPGVLQGTYLSAQLECTCTMAIPTKAVVRQVAPANQVLPVVHPTRTSKESNPQTTKRMGLGGPGPARSPKNGQNQSRKQARHVAAQMRAPFLHAVTWTWAKLPSSNTR